MTWARHASKRRWDSVPWLLPASKKDDGNQKFELHFHARGPKNAAWEAKWLATGRN